MSVDIEPTADLGSAGLSLASSTSKPANMASLAMLTRTRRAPTAAARCTGNTVIAAVSSRTYTGRSLHIVEEAVHGLLHFDAKIFRTLLLLFVRPGL